MLTNINGPPKQGCWMLTNINGPRKHGCWMLTNINGPQLCMISRSDVWIIYSRNLSASICACIKELSCQYLCEQIIVWTCFD